jgi:hypothetical protein
MSNLKELHNEECCPKFNQDKWDEKTFKWKHKQFIKESVPTFFHIPLPPMIGKKITKMMKMAEGSKKLESNKEDILLLFTDPSAFRSDIYLSVTDKVPNANNTDISGTFMSKVFDGAYKEVPKFLKQMDAYLNKQHKKAKNYYVHYAYCPKCAKEAGHNYMVLFAGIDE